MDPQIWVFSNTVLFTLCLGPGRFPLIPLFVFRLEVLFLCLALNLTGVGPLGLRWGGCEPPRG